MPGIHEDTEEMQEIHCHNCGRYVQFPIDLALNGRHEIHCPNCDHIHYRVVSKGKITEQRWGSSGGWTGATYLVTSCTSTGSSTSNSLLYFYSASTGTSTGTW